MASERAITKSTQNPLLQPLPAPKRPSEIIEEDEHLSNVSRIIERDFFPNLKKLKTQNEFLSAVEEGNLAKAKALGEDLKRMATGSIASGGSGERLRTPSASRLDETPICTGFTPVSSTPKSTSSLSLNAAKSAEEPRDPTEGLSLDAYQSKYTSEDNESFAQLLDAENEQRRQKYIWFFEKEKGKGGGKLLLEDKRDDEEDTRRRIALEEGASGNPALIEAPEHAVASVQTWKYKAKNALMYYQEPAPMTLADILSKPNSKLPPKSINHSATNFPSTSTSTNAVLRAASDRAADRLATQEIWRNMAAETPHLFPNGANTSSATGFTFVPSTPSLEPHADIDPEDLMTWGMIEGTPLLVDSGGDHGNASKFRIPDTPRREALADKLTEKARRDMKLRAEGKSSASASSTGNSGQFKKPLDPKIARMASPYTGRMLSPAAQKILGNTKSGLFGSSSVGKIGSVDSQLRASYSPALGKSASSITPKTVGFAKETPIIKTPAGRASIKTPSLNNNAGKPPPHPSDVSVKSSNSLSGPAKVSLTDNLLDF
ncbi:nuclear protein Es2-domain-containing protein [Obelidium mucronatum]|nr:nuclear protein Es2-domain-containing protein [Obelidium mucronatum]